MKYEFDPEKFANLVAMYMKQGYTIPIAIFFAIVSFPPILDAIVKGIELGGKHEAGTTL